MQFRSLAVSAVAVLSGMAGAATAQSLAADGSIVVQGERITRAEAQKKAAELVRAFGVANGERPAARWTSPVCLKIVGLSDLQTADVMARFSEIARQAKAPLAKTGCEPNAFMAVTDAAARETGRMMDRQPKQFEELPAKMRERYLTDNLPARWWYKTRITGKDGMAPSNNEPPGLAYGSAGGSAVPPSGSIAVSGDGGTLNQYNSSNISTQARRNLLYATVVIDTTQTGDVSPESIADFASLVLLAEITPGATTEGDSVLKAFEGEGSPPTLTAWDAAFLSSLYSIPLDRRAGQHRARLAGGMAERLGLKKKN